MTSEPSAPVVLPELPDNPPGRAATTRSKLQRHPDWLDLVGAPLDVENLKGLYDAALRLMPDVDQDSLWASLLPLRGQTFSRESSTLLAWRLAGNRHRLREGHPALPWSRQLTDEWMAFHIVGALDVPLSPRDDPGGPPAIHACLRLKCLSGSFCPGEVTKVWSLAMTRFLSHNLGFDRGRRGRHFLLDVKQLFGLRFWGMVEARRSDREPWFRHVEVPASLRQENRELIRMRSRAGKSAFRCPRDLPGSVACHVCAAGIDECPAATHREPYLFGACSRCGNREAVFAGSLLDALCVNCQTLWDLRSKNR